MLTDDFAMTINWVDPQCLSSVAARIHAIRTYAGAIACPPFPKRTNFVDHCVFWTGKGGGAEGGGG